ncbi:hypothetical protein MKZ38_003165 [Zalerion maritima]|uniref:NACHT domain-containing protein n=1 Tax=Zalerion maritima TaxID=339359 RepID=A0AAD5S0E1_9PEZI|nr:hypothetical protein MKZ38_003165 [Zalerion maritima]
MDPFSAIGLAGNLLQISQFAAEIVLKAREIHKSGSTKDNRVLEDIANSINITVAEVHNSSNPDGSDHEKQLCALATQCRDQSDELLRLLQTIKAARRNSLGSFKAAWKSHQVSDEKKELESRLEKTKSQIVLQLSYMSRWEQVLLIYLDMSPNINRRDRNELSKKLDEMKRQRDEDSEEMKLLKRNVDILVTGLGAVRSWADPKPLATLENIAQASRESIEAIQRQNTILAAVRFEGMDERFSDIDIAHQETFEWILNEEPDPRSPNQTPVSTRFMDWLKTGGGIFHISGKAGSGKSTLMKFLCNHAKTKRLLEEWAGPRQSVISHFFFWKPGTSRQRSIQGLIRSILYKILIQIPEAISDILDLEWMEAKYTQSLFINDSRLMTIFEKFISGLRTRSHYDYIFFIDGLDEVDSNKRALVEMLRRWAGSVTNNVKLVVSSREENIFTDSFLESQRIRIHDLTRSDMSRLVWDTLISHPRFKETIQGDEQRQHLAEAIVRLSGGIFLWVVLVLRAVMEGLDNGDSASRLEKKVAAMPRGLEPIFNQIYESVNSVDRNLVNLHLSFRLQSPRGCSLLRHSFLPDLVDDSSFARRSPINHFDLKASGGESSVSQSLGDRIDLGKRRLNGMCKGLLEIHRPSPHPSNGRLLYQVDFTHRSIVEFLIGRKDFLEFLNGELEAVYRLLGESLLAEIKAADTVGGLCFSHEFRYIAWAWNEIRHLTTRILDIFNTVPDWLPSFLQAAQDVLVQRIAPPQQKSLKTPRFLHTYNGVSHAVLSLALPARPDFYSLLYDTDFRQIGDTLPSALLAKSMSALLARNSSDTLPCIKFLVSKGLEANCRLIDGTDRSLQDVSISTWHIFLCVAWNWCDGWWQNDNWKANVCQVMNYWIEAGGDTRFKAKYRPTTTYVLDQRQVFLVTVEYEDGKSLPFPTLAAPRPRLADFIRDKEFSLGILDIFDFLELECTSKVEVEPRPPAQTKSLTLNDACPRMVHPEATKLVGPQSPLTWMEITFIEGAFRLARHTHHTVQHVFEGLVKSGHMVPPEADVYKGNSSWGQFVEKPVIPKP